MEIIRLCILLITKYQVPKVELYSKEPMRLTFIEGSSHDIDLLVRNESSWPYNWLGLIDNLQKWAWGIYIIEFSNRDGSGRRSCKITHERN